MAKNLNVSFPDDEIPTLNWAKATYGSNLSQTIRDILRELKDGKRVLSSEQTEEHEDRSAKLESIMIRFFSDIKSENGFIADFGEPGAKVAIDGRFGNLYAKCAGDDRLYLDARIEFENKYPKLARIAGMKE